ncbi:MAG: tRNA (N(6)-L-threonylcarbamoyladenosine(37)-C(2))-methylthiotransferase [Candidatus Kariarchaeaceae archaeon]
MPIFDSLQEKGEEISNLLSKGTFSINNQNQLYWSISTDNEAQNEELIRELAPFRVIDSEIYLFSRKNVDNLYHELLPSSKNLLLSDGPFKGTSLAATLYFAKQYSLNNFTFSVQSFGCSQNQAEGGSFSNILSAVGGTELKLGEKVDLSIISTCAVKQPTEDRMVNIIRKERNTSNLVLVTGCLPSINPKRLNHEFSNIPVIPINSTSSMFKQIYITEQGETDKNKMQKNTPEVGLPTEPVFHKKHFKSAIIPIAQGCLGNCSYCGVKIARGKLKSYQIDEIISHAKKAIEKGAVEIWITAQDTGAFGFDRGEYELPKLVKAVQKIPGNFCIRIGMLNPNHALQFKNELIEVFKLDKVYKFLHIPIQSGSDAILRDMNRKYTINEVKEFIEEIRQEVPAITLSTDIIVGYPTETEIDLQLSANLLNELSFEIVNLSRFMSRPKTKAAKLENLDPLLINSRSKMLTKIIKERKMQQNKKWLNWSGKVKTVAFGKEGTILARNSSYKLVGIKSTGVQIGQVLDVRINQVTLSSLIGSVLKD